MDCLDEGRELETLEFFVVHDVKFRFFFFKKKKAHLKYDKEAK
jgi:hypothetical protein